MDDKKFESLVEAMKNQHNQPPETPRDKMWERIDAARTERRGQADEPAIIPISSHGRWQNKNWGITGRTWGLAAAAAAVLILGITIGRLTPPENGLPLTVAENTDTGPEAGNPITPPSTEMVASSRTPESSLLYQKATADLFGRADALLTGFKVTPCANQDLEAVPNWAGGMLLQTRLLMDTPMAQDQDMRELLLDLELVLAQIVGISKENCARDVAWIRDAIKEKSTIDRLRLMQPEKLTHDAI